MIGISFSEILVIIFIACVFTKPSELCENIANLMNIIEKLKADGREFANKAIGMKLNQDSNYLEQIYNDILTKPNIVDIDKHSAINHNNVSYNSEYLNTDYFPHNEVSPESDEYSEDFEKYILQMQDEGDSEIIKNDIIKDKTILKTQNIENSKPCESNLDLFSDFGGFEEEKEGENIERHLELFHTLDNENDEGIKVNQMLNYKINNKKNKN